MSKSTNRRVQVLLQLGLFTGVLLFVNILSNARFSGKPLYVQFDLTEENRFTLTDGSRQLLRNLDDVVFINVLLEGSFPAGFKRLQNATREVLDDFRSESGYLEYEFEDPSEGSTEEVNARREELKKDNILPINLRVKETDGSSEQLIYPYAVCFYKGRSIAVNLLENEIPGVAPEVILNNSVRLLEYKFSSAIQKLKEGHKPVIAFTTGHGELTSVETADFEKTLRQYYDTGRIHLDSLAAISQDASLLVVAKPRGPFSEKDKFKLDQYVMHGGKILWLIDKIRVDLDSLQGRKEYFPTEYELNLEDLFFNYGVRIEPNLVLDMQCSSIPLVTGTLGNAPQFDLFSYPYHITATPRTEHPVAKSLNAVNLFYPSTIKWDIGAAMKIKRTPLLESSPNSRYQYLPVGMNFDFLRYPLDPLKFDKGSQTLSVLMEGVFPSMYKNRVSAEMMSGLDQIGSPFKPESESTAMIVVSDGDVIKNKVNFNQEGRPSFLPLGFNEFNKGYYANKDFLVNAVEYLMAEQGFIEARGKEVKLRLLDTVKAQKNKEFYQALNILAPLMFFGIFATIFLVLRKRKFAKQNT